MNKEQLDALKGHTPGPWACEHTARTENGLDELITENGHSVAWAYTPEDALLIAAAPDLLDHIDEQQRKIDDLLFLVEALEIRVDMLTPREASDDT